MRIFLCIMMIAIGLSGYCTSAHAATGMGKITQIVKQLDDTSKKDGNGDKADLKCHICCESGKTFDLTSIVVSMPDMPRSDNPVEQLRLNSNYVFSLLRPPKTLA